MRVSEVLDAAADRIEERGLWKAGRPMGSDSCVVLAMNSVMTERDFRDYTLAPIHKFAAHLGIGLDTWGNLDPLFAWNDAEHRTQEQVVKELRACAADLRVGEDV